jgi:hypothetical protein
VVVARGVSGILEWCWGFLVGLGSFPFVRSQTFTTLWLAILLDIAFRLSLSPLQCRQGYLPPSDVCCIWAYPNLVKQNLRTASRDFVQAARSGYSVAWFRLGRDYENFNNAAHVIVLSVGLR